MLLQFPLHLRLRPPTTNHRRLRRRPIRSQSSSGGGGGDPWRKIIADNIHPAEVQDRLASWLLKAQTAVAGAAAPLFKPIRDARNNPVLDRLMDHTAAAAQEELFMVPDPTVDRRTPRGTLSLAAVVSVEQFARMNGLTGRKMQKIFEALAPGGDGRSLVEYCCFRYLSRDTSDFHPSLKELAFQRLIFVTMLAWEHPYSKDEDSHGLLENSSLQPRLVGEEAFIRIAPAVAGIADISTAHHLFKVLVGDESGISLSLWMTYVSELIKVHQGRMYHQTGDILLSDEQVLCIGSSKKRPVLKWENNMAWPGNLTLTDSALHFEAIGRKDDSSSIRLDLTCCGSRVEKAKVGPFGSKLFDSAVSVSSGSKSDTWVLEFVDFGGEMRRDVWYAFISEIISLYEFIREYGPADDDPTIHHVYGAHRGKQRAIRTAANSMARLQALQFLRKLSDDPAKLVLFSNLRNVPYGDVVLQTLAVNIWGGPLITKFKQADHQLTHWTRYSEDLSFSSLHVFDIDGSVYLRKWMRSPSWASISSVAFWKNASVKEGIVLSKNLVVNDLNLVERAAKTCKEKSQIVEKTQATIDAAMIKGIPSNIDLFKELMLPCVIIAKKFDGLRRWEKPHLTISLLIFVYVVIFRNLLPYVFPMTLFITATALLLLRGLKEQGRLGRSFGKVKIRDQPPSNTIQKIIGLKEAMADMESFLQNLNISLLKVRTIVLAGQPEITSEVAYVLLGCAIILLVVPFKYVLAFLTFDLFTRELEFRREMVMKFRSFLRDRWASVHATPVVVLPYEIDGAKSLVHVTEDSDQSKQEEIQRSGTAAKS